MMVIEGRVKQIPAGKPAAHCDPLTPSLAHNYKYNRCFIQIVDKAFVTAMEQLDGTFCFERDISGKFR